MTVSFNLYFLTVLLDPSPHECWCGPETTGSIFSSFYLNVEFCQNCDYGTMMLMLHCLIHLVKPTAP